MKYPMSILVVDDVEQITEGMCRILRRAFEQCHRASDGVEALEVCARERVDVLITDLVMPRMNGLELLKAVRERFPDIHPVVVITGEAAPETLEEVRRMQVRAFSKPIDVSVLIEYLEANLPPR